MTHGDDSGLVLPPNVAPYQVVIVPIPRGNWKETVLPKAQEIKKELEAAGVRVKLDDSEENSPGWKFAEWELRGVPLRLEIGPKDLEKSQVFSARRDTRVKAAIPFSDLTTRIPALLEEIQRDMLARAQAFREEHTTEVSTWEEFTSAMEGRPGFVIANFADLRVAINDREEHRDENDTPDAAHIEPMDAEITGEEPEHVGDEQRRTTIRRIAPLPRQQIHRDQRKNRERCPVQPVRQDEA